MSTCLQVIRSNICPVVLGTRATGSPDAFLSLLFTVPRSVHHLLHVHPCAPVGSSCPSFGNGFLANFAKSGGGLEGTELLEVL